MNQVDELAHALAREYAVGLIDGCAAYTKMEGWKDISGAEDCDLEEVLKAVHYLELRGLLERWPGNPNVVRVLASLENAP